jgi:hypothetical protein
MKTVSVVKYAFTAVGVAMLLGAAFWYQSTRSFIATAIDAEGTVIELQPVRSTDSTTYRPIVRFEDQRGQRIEFSSATSSNPPGYSQGEKVSVLYPAADPHDARINGYFSLWGGATIIAGLGGVFTLVGVGIIFGTRFMRLRAEALRTSGVPIETAFQSVELNTSLSVNGRHPFRVLTQWQNPTTSQIHVFHSGNVWFDPTTYLTDKRIVVYIERGNPKKYFVDLSFLPTLAS